MAASGDSPGTCALTGASGFLGRHLISDLRSTGRSIVRLDRRPPAGLSSQESSVAGDLADEAALARLVDGADTVFHLAAFVHRSTDSEAARRACHEINCDGTRRLLDACRRRETPPFFVYVSSVAVYGASEQRADEATPCRPDTPYGRSKLEAEELVREYVAGPGRGVILRPSMFFGTGSPGNLTRLAGLIRRGLLPLIDGGANRKSMTHVSTVADAAILAASARDQANARTFIVTDDDSYAMRDVCRWIAQACGRKPLEIDLPGRLVESAAGALDGAGRLLGLGRGRIRRLVDVLAGSAEFDGRRIRAELGLEVRLPTPEAIAVCFAPTASSAAVD